MVHTTKGNVERAVQRLNDKAEALGWSRRFALRAGSNANGVQHVLEESIPDAPNPLRANKIGATYNAALGYLEAFAAAMESALAEREMERMEVLSGESSIPIARFSFDPDARSARRSGEEAHG